MNRPSKDRSGALAALLVVAAILFAVGAALEKAGSGEPSPAHAESSGAEGGHSEAEEGHSEAGGGEAAETSDSGHSEDTETLLGIDVESPLAVGAGVALSLLLAVLAVRTRNRSVLIVIALFALAFALLDGKEVAHQLDESRADLAALAGLVALLHLSAAGFAGVEARAEPR